MGGLVRRAVAVAGVLGVLLGSAAGVASASQAPALSWSPLTSAHAYRYRVINPGETASQVFTLTNTGGPTSTPVEVALTGSAAFTMTADSCSGQRLGTGASCTVTVQYSPASYGEIDDALLTATRNTAVTRLNLYGKGIKDATGITTSPSEGGPLGSTVTDTAMLSRGSSPTGTVTFSLYGPSAAADCSGTAVDTEQVTVSGDGSYTTPTGAVPAQTGTYWWTASYSGDTQNKSAATKCGSEQATIGPASPGITTSQHPATAVVGSAVADQATVTGGFSPTGTVTFTLYGDASCSGSPLFTDTENLSGGTATSAGYTTTATGTDYWVAAYNGDAGNNPVTSDCTSEPVSVIPASPGITTSQHPATAVVGSAVADQATVTGGFSATGTVTFTLYGDASCSGSPLFTDTENLSGGTATSAGYTTTATGTDYWVATYNGDAGNNPVTSDCTSEPVSVTPASPGITTLSSAGGPVGTTVTDTATLSGGDSPTGTITFSLYGPSATADCSGTALDTEQVTVSGDGSYTTPTGAVPAQAGTYWWTASYSGDINNTATATSCGAEQVSINTVTVTNPGNQSGTVGTAVSLQIHAADSQSGQTLTYSATGLPAGLSINASTGLISGAPTGAQTASVTVTATDTTGAHGSASFTWTISPAVNTVTVTNPGNQSGTVGTAVSLQIHAADSQSGQTLTYSATGLPAGLSINASTGLISGTPTGAQTASVTVTATDTTGAHGSASFTWTISTSSTCTSSQLLGNPGFESGNTVWTAGAAVIGQNGPSQPAHSGTWDAWLDGYGTTHTDTLSQTVTIPAACTHSTFTFWLHIDTAETTTTTAFDKLTITANSTTIATFSNLNHNTGYTKQSFSLTGFTGSVTLKFTGTEDSSLQTSFVVDDTAVNTG